MNGSAVLAMVGDGCVAIASDRRYGINLQVDALVCQRACFDARINCSSFSFAQTVGMDFNRLFPMGKHLYLGLSGLATDVQTVYVLLMFI